VDWSKIDAGLAGALAAGDDASRYAVLVHVAPGTDPAVVASLGVAPTGEGTVRTATLSAAEVARLSDRDEVTHLRMSRPLRPST